jgi:hypothetical protein
MNARMLIGIAALLLAAAAVPFQGCGDNDNSGALPCCPVCGDGVCEGDEQRCSCPADCDDRRICVATVPTCGDGSCQRNFSPGESHERCPTDCPLECRPCR